MVVTSGEMEFYCNTTITNWQTWRRCCRGYSFTNKTKNCKFLVGVVDVLDVPQFFCMDNCPPSIRYLIDKIALYHDVILSHRSHIWVALFTHLLRAHWWLKYKAYAIVTNYLVTIGCKMLHFYVTFKNKMSIPN